MEERSAKIAALLLAVCLLAGMTGCGRKDRAEPADPVFLAAPNYIAEDLAMPADTGELFGSCTDGESIWFLLAGEQEARAELYRADLAAGTVEALEEYQPPEVPEDAVLRRYGPILAPDGTLWVYEDWWIYHYDLPEDFDPDVDLKGPYFTGQDEFLHLSQLDPDTGKQKALADLSEASRALDLANTFGGVGFTVDGGGNLYLAGAGGVAVLDRQGKLQFTLETGAGTDGRLLLLPDGRAAALTVRPNGNREARVIDPAAQDWGGDAWSIPGGASAVFPGRGPCLFYYVRDDVLYGVVDGEELPQRLLSLKDTHLTGYSGMDCFALLDEGRLAVLIRRVPDSGQLDASQLQLALLSPTDQLPEDGKIKVVYGTIQEDPYVRSRINTFNNGSSSYYIEYRDYTEGALYLTETIEERNAVRDAARLRLMGEIAAGRAPDILDGSLPLDSYARAGYLEDLWGWIDGDPEISREGLMDHVLACAEADGKLCSIGSGFTIQTAAASRAAAGDRTGWTLEEMMSACGGTIPAIYTSPDASPRILFDNNAESILEFLLSMGLDRYVDWETGECRFDSAEFRDVLRLCTSTGTRELTYDPLLPALWEDGPALCRTSLSGPADLVVWDVMFGGPETLSAGEYEEALWDAGVLYTFVSPYNGQEVTNYKNAGFAARMRSVRDGRDGYTISAGMAYGVPDGKIYAVFPGFPAENGSGSSFTLLDRVAVAASSQAKEGAWAFVRTLLLPGGCLQTDFWGGAAFSRYPGFPINRAEFEELMEPRWCRVNEDGEIIPDKDGQPIEAAAEFPMIIGQPAVMAAYQMAPNEAQMERFWSLYNAIDHLSGGDEALMDIIVEQARPYFAGDKSLAETAKLIQNRASLYVNENR